MGDLGNFITMGGFFIALSLLAVAFALVFIGRQIKETNRILKEKIK